MRHQHPAHPSFTPLSKTHPLLIGAVGGPVSTSSELMALLSPLLQTVSLPTSSCPSYITERRLIKQPNVSLIVFSQQYFRVNELIVHVNTMRPQTRRRRQPQSNFTSILLCTAASVRRESKESKAKLVGGDRRVCASRLSAGVILLHCKLCAVGSYRPIRPSLIHDVSVNKPFT